MKYSLELKKFLNAYEEYKSNVLFPTYEELKIILQTWEQPEYWKKYTPGNGVAAPSPIRIIMTRIKHSDKVVDKIFRKSTQFQGGLCLESIQNMQDTIGVRVIVYFTSQLPLIDKEIRSSELFEISEKHIPEAYMSTDTLRRIGLSHLESDFKESGYSSIHYTLRLKSSSIEKNNRPFFEVQVRTLAQELWCELEHVLCYKPEHRPSLSAKNRLQILSREVGVIDEHFNLLYEDLIHNQQFAAYKDSDILNFENAPKVLKELGIQCSLTDLNPIIKILFSHNIRSIGDLMKVAIPRRLVTIRNTYVSTLGHAPNNVELISTLATLKTAKSKDIEIERIKSFIKYKNG